MAAAPSLYRRHRPRSFADVVGQEHVVRTLRNAVARDQVHHAYLFVGSRGTGKTSMAKILAASLNCVNGPTVDPCGTCDSCTAVAGATSLDVIEMDAASNNSVDDIRDLRESVAFAPVSGRHKVYILDEAHMLSSQAWNAFLKTLEEPPPRTVFVLATTEANKVLPTVVDRCHRFDFGRPAVEQVLTVLRRVAAAEQIDVQDGALALVARHATGSFRDALGTLEQLVTFAGDGAITPQDVLAVLGVADSEQLFAAVEAIRDRDPARALRTAAQMTGSGRDPGQVLRDLETHARELLTVQILGEVPPELAVTADRDARLLAQAREVGSGEVVRLLDLVSAALGATGDGAQPRIQLELALVKAASPQVDPTTAALLARIEGLERALRAGGGVTLSPPARAVTADAPPPPPVRPPEAVPEVHRAAPPEANLYGDPGPEAGPDDYDDPPLEPQHVPEPEPHPDPAPLVEAKPSVASTTADDLDLHGAIATWPAVVDRIKVDNAMIGTALMGALPVEVSSAELVVAFPLDASFMKVKAEQDEHRRAAQDAVRAVTGQALALRYVLRDPADLALAQAEPQLSGDELVQAFLREFNAEELPHDVEES